MGLNKGLRDFLFYYFSLFAILGIDPKAFPLPFLIASTLTVVRPSWERAHLDPLKPCLVLVTAREATKHKYQVNSAASLLYDPGQVSCPGLPQIRR